MKALYLKDLSKLSSEATICDDQVHHFVHVLRGQIDENVLLLDGMGSSSLATVTSMNKKEIKLLIKSTQFTERVIKSDLALGIPKKDYLASVLKSCTEIGVRTLHLIRCDYSSRPAPADRLNKVMLSALVQSNANYLPHLIFYSSLQDFLTKNSELATLAFITEQDDEVASEEITKKRGLCALIGPEGGFSSDELCLLKSAPQAELTRLPNPIMKTVTAVPFCLGLLQYFD